MKKVDKRGREGKREIVEVSDRETVRERERERETEREKQRDRERERERERQRERETRREGSEIRFIKNRILETIKFINRKSTPLPPFSPLHFISFHFISYHFLPISLRTSDVTIRVMTPM